ncbi:MAG TPA: helix-turn-helix domain-containing protein [Kofleriaceae bacterium]|nr:helix-turn-helix domain-containing protein [Kofleriaceae bacterium]
MSKKPPPETPLYVKLPNAAVEKLDRAAAATGLRKKDLVAGLLTKYLDTNDAGVMVGSYSFQPYDPPEIMNAEQAGQFLQIDEKMVIELAEAGKLPGKKLGPVWRFSRDALVAWLSTPEKR